MGKKSSVTAPSKISSSSTLTKAADHSTRASSILRSTFAPSHLQLRLFASVIQSFDSEHLRIHDASTARLRHQHSTRPNESIYCLDWGHYGPSYIQNRQSKKRKRPHSNSEDVVIAYGTSNSEICMYSLAQDKVLTRLSGFHERGVKDFKFFVPDNLEAWSIGGDGKLVQWDLSSDKAVRTISLPDSAVQTLAPPASFSPQLLCASNTPFTIDTTSKKDFSIESYDAFKHSVHTLIRSGRDEATDLELFLAVDNDRYINVFDIANKKITRTLVTATAVKQACLYSPLPATKNVFQEQILAVITTDGSVELFAQPFLQPTTTNGDMKAKRKGLTKKADAIVKLYGADKGKTELRILSANFDGPELVIMSVTGAVEPAFQRLRWQDEGSKGLLFEGVKKLVQIGTTSEHFTNMNGAKDIGQTAINEAKAVIGNSMPLGPSSQPVAIEISSSDEEDEGSDDGSEAAEISEQVEESDSETSASLEQETDQQVAKVDVEMEDATGEDPSAQPSFGELLAQKHPQFISITDQLVEHQQDLNNSTESRQAILPSGMSLGTVLTQSLRTNDQTLLETCLHVTDSSIIQNTILRLDSTLAATLLAKLAERLADRPGRYGHLLTWVQSTMIAHGGAIAGQPNVTSKLRTLYQVLNERSKVLPNILLLKGKLDMMNVQHSFRQQAEAQRRNIQAIQSTPAPIYIEGDDEQWSSSDDLDEDGQMTETHQTKSRKSTKDLRGLVSDEDSELDSEIGVDQARQTPLVNGIARKANGKLVDVEAEETDEDGVTDESDGENVDSDDDEEDEEDDDEDADEDEDSSMAGFINDGPVSEGEDDAADVALDEESTSAKPAAKKRRHR